MVRPSPKTRTVCAEKDNSEATASNAYLDEYVSSLRGASVAVRDEALQREIGTLASLIQSTGQGQRSGSSGAGSTTPVRTTNATPVEEAATNRTTPIRAPVVAGGAAATTPGRYRSSSATTAAATGVAPGADQAANQQPPPPPSRTQQQRQSELFVAQRFARYFMGRLLERIGGRQASLNSLDAAQLNIFNFYRRAVAEKLRDLAEERIEYHTFRRALRELYQRATDGAVPDLWAEFVRFCTAQRQGPVGSTTPTSAKAGTPPPGPKRSSGEAVTETPTSSVRSVEGQTVTARGYGAASSIPSTGVPKPGSSAAQRPVAARGPNPMQYPQSSSDQKKIALVHEAKGDQTSVEIPKDKAYSTATAREMGTLADRPPHRGQQDRQPGEHAKQRNDTEDDDYPHHDNDEDDDIERLVKVDLERERALLELENVVTTVVDCCTGNVSAGSCCIDGTVFGDPTKAWQSPSGQVLSCIVKFGR
ncbi:hypothetical protein F1559_001838 [Cyanidiococcus yangmingshanensis]|uniref:Uncharacterized protein n=1 Tax=Cyanidiococcus yangmingshanensis TaxID=2690220 RepID=A0A7J7IDD1_9RHOD|nr:hypothetical protein F1559_001838 [Cyanidiococcus yangmingshanensis]